MNQESFTGRSIASLKISSKNSREAICMVGRDLKVQVTKRHHSFRESTKLKWKIYMSGLGNVYESIIEQAREIIKDTVESKAVALLLFFSQLLITSVVYFLASNPRTLDQKS